MNRSLKLSMLMALALGSSQVLALDLGQIQVKSALGQPLLAEIPLHPANPGELRNLTVQLASSEDFARAGIAGGRVKIPLQFTVANSGDGQRVIRITSNVAVDDPYLDLLIEVNGKGGKSVREFAILLDPPGMEGAASVTSSAPTAAPARSVPEHAGHQMAAAVAMPRQARAAMAARSQPAASGTAKGQYGPVQRGQTLSSIARNAEPAGVDINQMLLALKQANPEAFYRDNINALKTGSVLRVPTASEAQAMAVAAAMAEVRRQNSDWRNGTVGKPTNVAEAAARAPSASASGNSGAGDRLALVPARDQQGAGGQGGTAGGKGDKSTPALQQDLLRTKESLASAQQQESDLNTRLKDLTDINGKNEHLLSLKDSEIAGLQAELAAARKATGMPAPAATAKAAVPVVAGGAAGKPVANAMMAAGNPTPAATGSAPVTPAAAVPVAGTSGVPAAATSGPKPAIPPAVIARPAKVRPVIVAKPASPVVEQPWYMQTWAWAAGVVVVVILILLAMLGRRRHPSALSKPAPSLADRFGSAPPGEHDESDIDQNELLDQLAEHPDDIGLHLELVTLYYSRRDVEHFEAAAEAMHAHITDPQQDEWQDVLHMGEDLVPGHPLFDHHVQPSLHEEAQQPFDLDHYASDTGASSAASSMPPLPEQTPRQMSGYNFNFDLGAVGANEPASGGSEDRAGSVPPSLAMDAHHELPPTLPSEPVSNWQSDVVENDYAGNQTHALDEFNDDPVDTKLDLARAYLDMGDPEGARAMLGEVMKEGSQMQQDVARRLLESLH